MTTNSRNSGRGGANSKCEPIAEMTEELSFRRASDMERVTRVEMRVDVLEDEVEIIKTTQKEILSYQREQSNNLKVIKYSIIFGLVGYTVSEMGPKGLELLAKVALMFA